MSRSTKRVLLSGACAAALLTNGASAALAQQQRERQPLPPKVQIEADARHDRIMIAPTEGGPHVVLGEPGDGFNFTFLSSEMAFDSKIVKGAPYSAEAVTESVQVLGDGNRITRKTTAQLYRDSEGRTRRDQTSTPVGPFATAEESPQVVFINDPVAGVNYVLNSRTRTAHKAMQYSFHLDRIDRDRLEGELRTQRLRTAEVDVQRGGTRALVIAGPQKEGEGARPGLGHRAVKRVSPVYPAVAKAAKAEGQVRVEIVINEAGEVESARAVDGHPLLREASVDAAKQWRFQPAMADGKPAKAKGFVSFSFVLPGEEMTAAARRQAETSAAGGDAGMLVRSGGEQPPQTLTFERRANAVGAELKAVAVPAELRGVKESLGKQMFDGVEAEGTRNTMTIPAGAIGNERAIQIVTERWFSAELQAVVMSRHSDPRFGETNYRLTNISRGEPDRSLFEVPAGYTVTTGGPFERRVFPARKPKTEQ